MRTRTKYFVTVIKLISSILLLLSNNWIEYTMFVCYELIEETGSFHSCSLEYVLNFCPSQTCAYFQLKFLPPSKL